MGILQKIVRFCLCCCSSAPDPLEEATDAQQRYISANDKESRDAQAHLTDAIMRYTEVADSYRATNEPGLRAILVNLATLTLESYHHPGSVHKGNAEMLNNRLQKVIDLNTEALRLPQSAEEKSDVLATPSTNLAIAYRERFIKNRKRKDIEESIKLFKQAFDLYLPVSPESIELSMEIGLTYWTLYNNLPNADTDRANDILVAEAIHNLKNAYERAAPQKDLSSISISTTCSYTLASIYCALLKSAHHKTASSDEVLLTSAINCFHQALEKMPKEDARRPNALWALSRVLFVRYERFDGGSTDLEESQAVAKEALTYRNATASHHDSLNVIVNFDPHASRQDSRESRNTIRSLTLSASRANSVEAADAHHGQPAIVSDRDVITSEPPEI